MKLTLAEGAVDNTSETTATATAATDDRSTKIPGHALVDLTEHNEATASPMPNADNELSSSGIYVGGPPTQIPHTLISGDATPRYMGWKQAMALLEKNILTKYRSPLPTFFEIFSPVLMMLVLVAAYTLSEITERSAGQYTTIRLDIPGPWLDLAVQAGDFASLGNMVDQVRRRRILLQGEPLDSPNRKSLHLLQELDLASLLGVVNNDGGRTISSRRLQSFDDEVVDDANITGKSDNVFELLDDARIVIRDLLKNPLLVPTFSQYVSASLALSSFIDADELPIILSDSSFGREWGNLLTLGTIHISPNTPVAMDFWIYLNETYPTLLEDSISVRIHESESHAVEYIIGHLNERTWVLVDFSNCRDADDFQYKIRMNYTTLPNTNLIVNTVAIGLSRRYQRYYLSGYLSIQRTVNEFALSRNNCEQADTNMWSMPMPTAAYSQNSFFQAVGFLLGLTIAMAYLYPTSRTIKSMVEEKETRMKETLYILGVRPWAHWLSWVLTTGIIFLLITILVTYTLASQVLLYSSPAYLLAFIGLFSTSTMGFCFVIASFFSRAKLAAIVGPMALFATLLPRFIFFGSNRYEAINAKKLASLLPCTAFAFGADIIADYEYAEVGVQSFNANMGDYSFNTSLSFLFLDTFLYMFLGWYLELVIPRQYGVARPFYFILLPSYWWSCVSCLVRRQAIRSGGERSVGIVSGERTADSKGYEVESEDVEPVTDPLLVARVSIHALVKRYSRKHDDPPAVNNLNLTMYESQITCLLGHNGAGKTSTISMLTGLFPPTTGDCVIYGNSIIHDTSNARQSMGICPQHNVLFDRLTVIEHLTFFQKIKGLKPTKDDVRDKALEVGLGEYFTTTSSALSGGNKRKLSLAIALCGDPRFLLLDEPTSGMDPASRRACWELLRQKRLGRVTLLTTHFLDEASLLADRIAVMKEGQLQCCGSELFLKNRFGLGYNLTIVMNANSREPCADESGEFDPTSELLDERNILAFFNGVVPGTELVRKSAREITFRFPQGLESLFPDAFDALEAAKDRLGIGAYGISNTTLEEVFLQLVEKDSMPQAESGDTNSDDHASSPSVTEKGTVDFGSDDELVRKGLAETPIVKQEDLIHISAFRQVILLYMKRFVIQRRDLKGGFFMIVLPVILCGLVLLVLTLDIVLAGPAIDMSLSLYKPSASDVVGLTDVLVGGGASMVQDSVSRSALSGLFSNLSTSLHAEYPNTNFSHKVDAISSSNLSQYLLDTYNDHDHNSRYGAFALRDIVPLQLNVDWDALSNDLNNSTFFGEGGTLDFGSLRFNITTKNVVDVILALSPFDVNATINSTMLHSITSQAIKDIINSAANSNSSLVSQNLQGAFSDFVNDIALIGDESVNATLIRAVVRFFDGIAFAVTDGVIEALNSTKYADYFEALKESDVAFDRQIIRDGWVDLFHGISVLDNGTDFELNSTTLVDDFLRFYDDIVNSFDNSTEKGPNALLLVPLIFVDGFLQEAIANNATSTRVEDVLLRFSDLLSGSKGDEGNLHLRAEAVLLEVSTLRITFVKATIGSGLGVLLENEDIVLPLNGRNFLPPGIQTYEFDFDSSASILHNSSSPHAVAAFNQAYAEFLYKQCSTNPKQARLLSVNHPLPLTTQQSIEIQTTLSVLASLFLLIPYCYIPAAFVVFLVKERVSKSKHLQLVSGVNMSSYWISTYLWDLSLFFLLSILVILVFLIYGQEAAVVFVGTTESLIATFALTFGYGLSALPFAYLLSRSFNNHSSAQIAIMGIFFITGFVAVNAYFILISIETTKDLAEALLPYFRSWPAYNVGEGFISLSNAYWEREILGSTNRPFDWDVTGRSLALIYGLSVPYFCVLLMLEYSDDGGSGGLIGRVLRNIRGSYESISLRWHGVYKADDGVSLMLDDGLDEFNTGEDEDVAAERTHVIANSESLKTSASVLLVNMWKVYPPSVGVFGSFVASIRNWFSILCCHLTNSRQETEVEIDRSFLPKRAVRGITTSIPQGETYGLLGVNGAGKTTTLGVLTGDITPTSGLAYVAGHDVTGITPGGVAHARKHIGFCPQVDPLLELMTGRETLIMFGKLRGIPPDDLQTTVLELLDQLTLTPYADKVSQSYSGGNKRKLSLGVALIGDPRVLFIDEASSGMDPAARRHMWELIGKVSRKRSTVLTSHSMEEAEALCTRVAIMVKGKMLCLGSVQHVKTKYLDGYTIDVHCTSGTPDSVVDGLVQDILARALPGSVLAERHGRFLRFDMSSLSRLGLGTTFRRLQELKEQDDWRVENYSISQCSLEQVFIKLVKQGNSDATAIRGPTIL